MKVLDGGTCGRCGGPAVILCDGCGTELCRECRIFDLWCFGCGHGTPRAFCKKCYNDPEVNLWLQEIAGDRA